MTYAYLAIFGGNNLENEAIYFEADRREKVSVFFCLFHHLFIP